MNGYVTIDYYIEYFHVAEDPAHRRSFQTMFILYGSAM